MRTLRVQRNDRIDVSIHAEQQRIHGMTSGAQQAAAPTALLLIPAVLAIPWANPMVVVHFPVVHAAEQASVDGTLHGQKLSAVAHFKTNTGAHPGLLYSPVDLHAFVPVQGNGLLENEVLAGFGRSHRKLRVVPGITRDVNHLEITLRKESRGIREGPDRCPVLRAEFRFIERSLRQNRSDTRFAGGLQRRNMSRGGPAVANDTSIEDFGHVLWGVGCVS